MRRQKETVKHVHRLTKSELIIIAKKFILDISINGSYDANSPEVKLIEKMRLERYMRGFAYGTRRA